MNEAIIQFILDRLDAVPAPVFSPSELSGIPPSEWENIEKNSLLRRAPEPESIDRDGKLLAVRRSGDLIFGFDEYEEFPRPVPLTKEDLISYRINLSGFLDAIRQKNIIRGTDAAPWHDFHHIGRRQIPGLGMVSVFFSFPNVGPAATERRLHLLTGQSGIKVVVFPVWPAIDTSSYSHDELFIADLTGDLSINWPGKTGFSDSVPEYAFLATGRKWVIHFLGERTEVDPLAGMDYIAKVLQKPDEAISLRELEEEIFLTNADKQQSGDLSARLDPDSNLETITPETLENYRNALRLLKEKIREAKEDDNVAAVEKFTAQHSALAKQIRKDTTPWA